MTLQGFRSVQWRVLERVLLVIGIVCAGYVALVTIDRQFEQAREDRELDRILTSRSARPAVATPTATQVTNRPRTPRANTMLGRIEIPRLGVKAVVLEGDDVHTLRRAVGHIPGTSLPGQGGNAGLAAHRDTFFRRLKDIRPTDEIRFTSAAGVQHYIVQDTLVVDPTDVAVLDPTASPTMTLVTCYPFTYLGSAPQRFIVRAIRREAMDGNMSVAAAVPVKASTVEVKESQVVAKPVRRMKAPAASSRTINTSTQAKPTLRSTPKSGNAFSRFFKAAARGLGFAPRESREAAQNESPDPRPPGR